jgi:hypothetical protein
MTANASKGTRISSVAAVFLLAAAFTVSAQAPVVLSSDDIYLMTRPGNKTAEASGHLCGFQIRGNHRSHASPRVEWDFNIDQIEVQGGAIAGVSAGVFDVTGHDRKPRPAIVDLSFSIEGDPEPIAAKILGSPNADNGVKGALDVEPAYRLFTALGSDAHQVVIALKFADGSAATVQIRGNHDWRKFGGGKNSFFDECLRGQMPPRGFERLVP